MANVDAPFMQKVFHMTERKRETNLYRYCKLDDFRDYFKVAEWRMFYHLRTLQKHPARLKQLYSNKAGY